MAGFRPLYLDFEATLKIPRFIIGTFVVGERVGTSEAEGLQNLPVALRLTIFLFIHHTLYHIHGINLTTLGYFELEQHLINLQDKNSEER